MRARHVRTLPAPLSRMTGNSRGRSDDTKPRDRSPARLVVTGTTLPVRLTPSRRRNDIREEYEATRASWPNRKASIADTLDRNAKREVILALRRHVVNAAGFIALDHRARIRLFAPRLASHCSGTVKV
jgi:hypothetical protein